MKSQEVIKKQITETVRLMGMEFGMDKSEYSGYSVHVHNSPLKFNE